MLIPIVFMVIASAALLAAIGFLWSSFRSAFGTTDAFNLPDASADSRRSLEERKAALLTNINDLEFDHQARKVSDEDFKALHTKLRTEAKRVLRLLDEDVKPFRAQAEALTTGTARVCSRQGGQRSEAGNAARRATQQGGKRLAAETTTSRRSCLCSPARATSSAARSSQ